MRQTHKKMSGQNLYPYFIILTLVYKIFEVDENDSFLFMTFQFVTHDRKLGFLKNDNQDQVP